MRCPYKLLRMVLALVCSEYPAVPPTPGVQILGVTKRKVGAN